jgi:hypothetical protein
MKTLTVILFMLLSLVLLACGEEDQQQDSQQIETVSYSNPAQGLTVTIKNNQSVLFELNSPLDGLSGQASCGAFNDQQFITQPVIINKQVQVNFPSEILDSAEYCQLTWNSDQDSAVVVFDPQQAQQTTSSSYGSVNLNGDSLTVDFNTISGESLVKEFINSPTIVSCQYNGVGQQVQAKQIIDWKENKQSTTLPVDISGRATSCKVGKQDGGSSQETLFSFAD